MKLISVLSASIALTTLCGADHYPSLHFNFDGIKKNESHFHAHHQVSWETPNQDVLLLQGGYKPFLRGKHHFEGGISARKFTGDWGFGGNLFYRTHNLSGVFAHQLSPGWEFFYKDFQLSLNIYNPTQFSKYKKLSLIEFKPAFEGGITWRPKDKYEFSVFPNFCRSEGKFGVNMRFAAFISNSIELELKPYLNPRNKGICFGLGCHLGGPKSRMHQSVRKYCAINYEIHKFPRLKLPKVPISNTIEIPQIRENPISSSEDPVIKLDNELEIPKNEVPEPPVQENIASPQPITKEEARGWVDFFFSNPFKKAAI